MSTINSENDYNFRILGADGVHGGAGSDGADADPNPGQEGLPAELDWRGSVIAEATPGGTGGHGNDGMPGKNGGPGDNARDTTLDFFDVAGAFSLSVSGGRGGNGGPGGDGSEGGAGGKGVTGKGKKGSEGGKGGRGGDGGPGGNGGNAGASAEVWLYIPEDAEFTTIPGHGTGGRGGAGAQAAHGGRGGSGQSRGDDGAGGNPGKPGLPGSNGPTGKIHVVRRPKPEA